MRARPRQTKGHQASELTQLKFFYFSSTQQLSEFIVPVVAPPHTVKPRVRLVLHPLPLHELEPEEDGVAPTGAAVEVGKGHQTLLSGGTVALRNKNRGNTTFWVERLILCPSSPTMHSSTGCHSGLTVSVYTRRPSQGRRRRAAEGGPRRRRRRRRPRGGKTLF